MTYALLVRFTLRADCQEQFDALTRRTIQAIATREPGTEIYAAHRVESAARERIFYELYRDKGAHLAHTREPHIVEFMRHREELVESFEVDELTTFASTQEIR